MDRKKVIDEHRLAALRQHWDGCNLCKGDHGCVISWHFLVMEETLIALWAVARAAQKIRLIRDDQDGSCMEGVLRLSVALEALNEKNVDEENGD